VAMLVLAVACETPPPTGLGDVESRPVVPDEALTAATEIPCEPLIYLDGDAVDRSALAAMDPARIESVEVLRGDLSLRTAALTLEPGTPDPRAEPSASCGVILMVTRGASLEAQERMRRLKETLVADRAGGRGDEAARYLSDGPSFTPMTVRPQLRNVPEVQQALIGHYPPLLRDAGIGGEALIWFFITEDGAVQDTRIHRSSGHDALDQAALAVAGVMEFTPAYNRDVRVPVWIAMPIRFEATAASADARDAEASRAPVRQPVGQDATEAAQAGDRPVFTPMTERPQLMNSREVQQALQRHYPPLLRDAGIGGIAVVWVFIDETGRVRDARISTSSGYDALDQAALRVTELMQFTAARDRDTPVPVWIALPVTFAID
jgi:TonB family protein